MLGIVLSGIAALSLLAVGLSAVVKQRTAANVMFMFVVFLLAGIEVSDQLSLQQPADLAVLRRMALLLEALLPAACIALSFIYHRKEPYGLLSKGRFGILVLSVVFPMTLIIAAGDEFFYSPDFPGEAVLFLGNAGYWYYIGIMGAMIISLVNIEATLTATYGMDRYRMKFETIGLMSVLAVLIFYYSQGLLYRTINMNLMPIRSGVLIVASFLIIYSRMIRGNGVRVSISRQVFYRSIALLAVGLYLLALGLVGEGMRYFGVHFGRDLTVFLAFAAGILMLAVLISEKARRTAKVYISKHFYAHKHDYREEWIKLTGRLAACSTFSEIQETILAVYQETFGLKGASLYLLSRDDSSYLRGSGTSMPEQPQELPLSPELRGYFMDRERVLNLKDGEHSLSGREEALFREAGAVLAVPLICNSKIEGILVLGEQLVPERLTYEDYDFMKVMARQAAHAITNFRLSDELLETRGMAAVARISSFVIHDLKNLTTSLSLVVDNAQEHIGNPEFQKDAIATVKSTLEKMRQLMQRLKVIPDKFTLDLRLQDIDRFLRVTVAELAPLRPGVCIASDGSPVYSIVDSEEIKKVIVNIVQNAWEANGENGSVLVETFQQNGSACIRITDQGPGMTDDFIMNHLFKPFRTTKEKGLGIGLYQCRQIVEAHHGRIEVKSEVGKGSVFTIVLPGADAEGQMGTVENAPADKKA